MKDDQVILKYEDGKEIPEEEYHPDNIEEDIYTEKEEVQKTEEEMEEEKKAEYER